MIFRTVPLQLVSLVFVPDHDLQGLLKIRSFKKNYPNYDSENKKLKLHINMICEGRSVTAAN